MTVSAALHVCTYIIQVYTYLQRYHLLLANQSYRLIWLVRRTSDAALSCSPYVRHAADRRHDIATSASSCRTTLGALRAAGAPAGRRLGARRPSACQRGATQPAVAPGARRRQWAPGRAAWRQGAPVLDGGKAEVTQVVLQYAGRLYDLYAESGQERRDVQKKLLHRVCLKCIS